MNSIIKEGSKSTNKVNYNKSKKREKGKSLLELPDNYIIIDLETTGFSFNYDSIIEVGILRIKDGEIIDSYDSLVQPNNFYGTGYLDPLITSITGITDDMLSDAPYFIEISDNIINFIGDSVIVSHNVHFDINFLYDNLLRFQNYKLSNNCWDLLRISRILLPDLENHKLITVADFFDYKYIAHRSISDCLSTFEVIKQLNNYISKNNININEINKEKRYKPKFDLTTLKSNNPISIDEDNTFYKKNICFTGKLDKFTRKEAAQISVNLGAKAQNGVTKQTDFLVLGDFDYVSNLEKGEKSSKLKKAEKYRLNGQDIKIINEATFLELLDDNL